MRRVTRPVWLALLLLAIGVAVAILWGNSGCLGRRPTGGEARESSPGAASIDTGGASLRGAGLLAEGERPRTNDRPLDVVKPEPPVSMDPAGPGEVVGQVVDPEGRPVVAALALYVDGPGYRRFNAGTTDASGRFRMRPRAGIGTEWSGVVALTRPLGRTAPLTPARSGAAPLRIVASPAREARISVVDESGKGVAIARVRVGRPIGAPSIEAPRPWIERAEELASWFGKDTYTDRAGVAVVMQGPTPATVLTVTGPLDRDLLPATLVGWDGGDATIRMTAKPRVEGTVREVDGALLTDGRVWWRRTGTEEWKDVRVEYDGTFSIDCGEPGAIELCPRMHSAFPRPPVASQVVPSGATNVALLTEAGPTLDVRLEGWIDEAQGIAELIREPADAKDAPRLFVKIDDGRILVRGLDSGATYTLWVPPLSRMGASPTAVEPSTRCVLRTGLRASVEPITVPLTLSHPVQVSFAREGRHQPWQLIRIIARGHGARLDLPFQQDWREKEGFEGKAGIALPDGPFRIRVEAELFASTEADLAAGRILMREHAGEADWETETERVEIRLEPTSDAPVDRRGG